MDGQGSQHTPSAGEMVTPFSTAMWVKHLLTVREKLCAQCDNCYNVALKILVHWSAVSYTVYITYICVCVS